MTVKYEVGVFKANDDNQIKAEENVILTFFGWCCERVQASEMLFT